MKRGSYAVEFALLLPMLLVLASAVIDLGQYLLTVDTLVSAVSDGARAGALADPDDGDDPILTATFVADRTFTASDMLVGATFSAASDGTAAPDEAITLTGVADVQPFFGILSLPPTVTYQVTVRLAHQ